MPHYRSKRAETSKRPRQNHQKGRHNKNCCNRDPRSSRPQDSTSAMGVNITKTPAQNDHGRD